VTTGSNASKQTKNFNLKIFIMELKKEWNRNDFTKVDRKLCQYFGGKSFKNHRGEMEYCPRPLAKLEMVLGLPYTSTGIFACYSLSCNTNLFHDEKYYYDYAAMTKNGDVVLLLSDYEENEKAITI
jgi:hypothetical protein